MSVGNCQCDASVLKMPGAAGGDAGGAIATFAGGRTANGCPEADVGNCVGGLPDAGNGVGGLVGVPAVEVRGAGELGKAATGVGAGALAADWVSFADRASFADWAAAALAK
jgi:hypothetical protein